MTTTDDTQDRWAAVAAQLDRAGFDLTTRRSGNAAVLAALDVDGGHAKDILAAAERAGRLPEVAGYLVALTLSFATAHLSGLDRAKQVQVLQGMFGALEQEVNDNV